MTNEVREKLLGYIKARTSNVELTALIAEEAAELTHAALKYRRVLEGTSPTPVTLEEAREALMEEVADVLLLVTPKGNRELVDGVQEIQDRKLRRWADRLREKEAEQ
jgi:NTP pyrophosphatase (non-canonical NTP hydrolase)